MMSFSSSLLFLGFPLPHFFIAQVRPLHRVMHALIPSLSLLVKFMRLHDPTLDRYVQRSASHSFLIYWEDHLPLIIIMHLGGLVFCVAFFLMYSTSMIMTVIESRYFFRRHLLQL